MPAEAHRLQQPIGVRDRRLLRALTCLAALVAAAVIAISLVRRAEAPPPARVGCLKATVAGVMGGGTISGCGTQATALCRTYARDYPAVAAQCAALTRRRGPAASSR